ncbi:unnamed protein product, partial [Didymodactylos carnosus]
MQSQSSQSVYNHPDSNDIGSNGVILSNGNDVVIADDISNAEKTFYAKVDDSKNGLSSGMRQKTMITVSYYNKILNALKQTTSGKETGVNSYFYAWCKKFFRVDNCAVGEFIGVKIDKVDRTNTDPKLLPCVIIDKKHHDVKVVGVNGIIDQWWPLESLVRLSAVSQELRDLNLSELKEIPPITASKLFVRNALNGVTCSCK